MTTTLEATHLLTNILATRARRPNPEELLREHLAGAMETKAKAIREGYNSVSNPLAPKEDQYKAVGRMYSNFLPSEFFIQSGYTPGGPCNFLAIAHISDAIQHFAKAAGEYDPVEDDPNLPVYAVFIQADPKKEDIYKLCLLITPDFGDADDQMLLYHMRGEESFQRRLPTDSFLKKLTTELKKEWSPVEQAQVSEEYESVITFIKQDLESLFVQIIKKIG